MMYPFMTLNDNTEITHSEMKPDGKVKVYIETPDEKYCFKHATCWLPDYKWEDVFHYSDEDISRFTELIRSAEHLILAIENPENIEVFSAKPLDDMMMLLTFSTGEQRLFDATLLTGPAFAPLSDEKIFKTCKVVDGVVTWMDESIDCAPEYMYEHSYPYSSLDSVN